MTENRKPVNNENCLSASETKGLILKRPYPEHEKTVSQSQENPKYLKVTRLNNSKMKKIKSEQFIHEVKNF